ncbi:hypothetical protein DYB26_014630 [Aphanomyces astaci]|uniref:Myb/SANT-like domain-containing protein n=1 Tax=Aphanomyces astaci TaxID=112090 RepID=A0A418FIM0_APHAT|nr:hypothetical protein DYB26_014630 [Aphanomyces astaci]
MEELVLTVNTAPQPPPPPNTTKRRAKVKQVTGTVKAPKTVWTTEMVTTLLDKRCDDYGAGFELHRSPAQLSILWGKIALSINVLHGTSVPAVAAKNKYTSLKREFSTIRLAEGATGNAVGVVYPQYWDELVSALGSKDGLGHIDYAFGASLHGEEGDGDGSEGSGDVSAPTTETKRQAVIDAELSRQRAKRPKRMDIGQSLVALGESLAQGMKGMHQPRDDAHGLETSKLLVAIDKLQVAVDQSTSIQSELLNFLRRNN